MTDLRKAAEDLVIALKGYTLPTSAEKSMHVLTQALAQPEQEQKTPLKVLNLTVFTENRLRNGRVYDVETLQAMTNRDILAIPDMGKKALKEVMEALYVYAVNMSQERVDETAKREHEPVAYLDEGLGAFYWANDYKKNVGFTPLYTAPPKREWVGLTSDDVHDAFNYVEMVKLLDFDRHRPDWCEAFASACEATLRHKNGGNK